ncbi:HNH endonuclease signature motif containing protein [Pseudomonas knackmussii]|uniref:HNH endonuclease signature motif containing protein n=1 Tax=Pseudomonas knackmussii TaxID=65741 RepID=UPI001362CF68|nr:HNH endonuclease signature motif containing protein [Pseudomonas knackmussii]
MLTQQRLKELFKYDADTGFFERLVARGPAPAGAIASRKNSDGYCRASIDGREYLCHRLAFLYMTGSMPDEEVDHINHVRDDNRWINLRQASRSENCTNKGRYRNSGRPAPGVAFRGGSWIATIWKDGQPVHIGSFKTMSDAVSARHRAQQEMGFHTNHGRK